MGKGIAFTSSLGFTVFFFSYFDDVSDYLGAECQETLVYKDAASGEGPTLVPAGYS